jgi:Flp pilus assembly protein protease CpaA
MTRVEQKHSLATRLFLWTDAPVLAVMIWSGLLTNWAYRVYAIRLGGFALIQINLNRAREQVAHRPQPWLRELTASAGSASIPHLSAPISRLT